MIRIGRIGAALVLLVATASQDLPADDYWVQPMREVHQRFRGKPGTLAQYGDSITCSMAFLAAHAWGKTIEPKNCPPDVRADLDVVQGYANRELWRSWKEAENGNAGSTTSEWFAKNVDHWQKKLQPEAAVVLFGTNDLGRTPPDVYQRNMTSALRRMLADGTVPMLTTVPLKHGADDHVKQYRRAVLAVARELKVPVIDYHAEILRRRPDDWDGQLEKFGRLQDVYQVPTLISGDGVHPSNPREFENDFSPKALDCNGFNLRNYLTLRTYANVIRKVFSPEKR